MSEKVNVVIGGQFVVKFDGTVEISRKLFDKLSAALDKDEEGISEDVLLGVANALRDGYTDDFVVDCFELSGEHN